jgi:hypothetical protein
LLLLLVAELSGLGEVLAHPAHLLGERPDGLQDLGLLQVAGYLMAVPDGRGLVQWGVEEGREVVVLAARGHRRQHLIKMQVIKAGRFFRRVEVDAVELVKEDAVEPLDSAHPRHPGRARGSTVRSLTGRRLRAEVITAHHELPPFDVGRSHQP